MAITQNHLQAPMKAFLKRYQKEITNAAITLAFTFTLLLIGSFTSSKTDSSNQEPFVYWFVIAFGFGNVAYQLILILNDMIKKTKPRRKNDH
jgi:TRAP-type C4-dicarboxylate transport system permease large subunit